MIKVDKDVPMPSSQRSKSKYPWLEMEVGDSFYADTKLSTMSNNASGAGRRSNRKFACRKEGKGTRVWRIE